MKRRLTAKDAAMIGNYVLQDAEKHLSPEQIERVKRGSTAQAGPYSDHDVDRELLSDEQRAYLSAWIDFGSPPEGKTVREVIEFIRELYYVHPDTPDVAADIKEDRWIDWMPYDPSDHIIFLVVLVNVNTGEHIPHWRTDW